MMKLGSDFYVYKTGCDNQNYHDLIQQNNSKQILAQVELKWKRQILVFMNVKTTSIV